MANLTHVFTRKINSKGKSPLHHPASEFAGIDNKHASLQGELKWIVGKFNLHKLYVNKEKVNINHEVREN